MLITAIFLVVWLLFTLALRSLAVRLRPSLASRRSTLLVAGVVALAATYPVIQRMERSSPAAVREEAVRWPEHVQVPAPRRVPPDLLARLPFTTVQGDGLMARAMFVEGSRRRPVALMALRLADETTRQVQRYLVLHGDTLELIMDERRRAGGGGELYALPLEEVVLAACDVDVRDCRTFVADSAAPPAAAVYRILARFPGDTAFAVWF